MDNLLEFKNTERALREYGERVAAAYREKMRGHGHFTMTPDTLIDHIDVDIIREGGGGISVALDLNKYWKYVEWDTRPHFPPIDAIRAYVTAKPILPQPNENGKIPTPEQIAWAIRGKIGKEGTKGTHDLAEAVDMINARYMAKIEEAVTMDIDAFTDGQITLLFGKGSI